MRGFLYLRVADLPTDCFYDPEQLGLFWKLPRSLGVNAKGIFCFGLRDIDQRCQFCMASLAALQFETSE